MITLTVTSEGWSYSLFESDEKGRISIERERDETEVVGIEREHALYEPIKNLIQCINEMHLAVCDHHDTITTMVKVTDDSTD